MNKLGRLIETREELIENLEQVESYLCGMDENALNEMIHLIGNGTNFVAYKIANSNEMHFAPSRFIGYLKNSLKIHLTTTETKKGTKTSPQIDSILHHKRKYDDQLEKLYLRFCVKIGAKPKEMIRTQRKYWVLEGSPIELFEGGVTQFTSNRYERNPEARKRCIEKFGTSCLVCGMSFQEVYGKIGADFIHVHHIIPLSRKKKEHVVDIENLIPVCPNCHAMLHRGNVSVDKLRLVVKRNKKKK